MSRARFRTSRAALGSAVLLALSAAGSAPLPAQAVAVWSVTPEPLVELGAIDGAQGVLFTRIVGAVALADGRYVVADGGENHLVLVAADGALERTVGREGEGPGEFTNLRGVWTTPEGGFATWDSRQRRFTRFAPDGTMIDTKRAVVPADDARLTGANLDGFHGVLSDGRVVLAWIGATGSGRGGSLQETLVADRMVYGLFDMEGHLRTVLGQDSGMIRWFRNGRLSAPLPHSPYPWTTVAADTVVSTDGLGNALFFGPLSGGPARVLALPGQAPDRADAWSALESLAAAGALDDVWVSVLAQTDPDAGPIPVHGRMLGDDAGRLWLKAYDPASDALAVRPGSFATGGTWTVIETDGTPVATLAMPDDLAPLAVIGDRMLALGRDAFDVERFVVVRLVR